MNREEILKAVHDGDITLETLVDSYLLMKEQVESNYQLTDGINRAASKIDELLATQYNYIRFLKEIAALNAKPAREKWQAFLDYMIGELRERSSSDLQDGNLYGFIEIDRVKSLGMPAGELPPWLT